MSSKAFVFLGLLFAFVLLISSNVAASNLAHTSVKTENVATMETNGVEDAKYGGYDRGYRRGRYDHGGHDGHGHGGYRCRHGWCRYRCCSYAGEVVEGAKP
ncbi:Glycine-rich protein, partial [Cucurbita argyrosperma subsp. sororia]